ncbi:MAG: DUF1549 domain-containing protein [Pirellulaceae bacterium]
MDKFSSIFRFQVLLFSLVTLPPLNLPVQADPKKNANNPSVNFARDVRPILSNACFHCHGPDEAERQADLRLDTEDGLQAVLNAGDAANSELVRRIMSRDPNEQMPPPESNKSLDEKQRKLLEQWVAEGAEWQQHWSFVQPTLPVAPRVDHEDWCRTDIDRFILARQEAAGLTPAPAASPAQLLRRLYLDLIGLPPTLEESERWLTKVWPDVNASSDGTVTCDEAAYQELVSELLASPHYGERWARRWLDLARYADTNGYEKDRDRSIWPYRDWVVNAFNADMPFDQFTIEQLAGDMLPNATVAQRIATGFHRNTMLNEEGGIDPLEFRFHAMTDRVATTGTTWLGLTLGCCQCHTHKYDPIAHTEYYQLMAFLDNADEPMLELPDEQFSQTWAANREKADALLRDLPGKWPTSKSEHPESANGGIALEAAFEQWLIEQRKSLANWQALHPTEAMSNLPILTIQDDESIFASGDTAKRDEFYVTFAPVDFPIYALQLETLPDERLPARGPGSTYYEGTLGDFYLTEFSVSVAGEPFSIQSASDSYAKNRYGKNPVSAQLTIDGDVQTGWSVHGRQGERHVAVYVMAEPIPAGQSFTTRMILTPFRQLAGTIPFERHSCRTWSTGQRF